MKHKHAELIKAWADGAQIQIRDDLDDIWLDTNSPSWVAEYQYRIKQEPKPDMVRYFVLDQQSGDLLQNPYHNVRAIFDGETGNLKSAEVLSRGQE